MNKKVIQQLDQVNKMNAQVNTLCHTHFINSKELVTVTVEDIFPSTRDQNSFFITVQFRNVEINACGSVINDCIMFYDFKIMPESYLPLIHKIILSHAFGIARKYKKRSLSFMIREQNVFDSLCVLFWKMKFTKSTGSRKSENKIYTFGADIQKLMKTK